MTHWRKPNSKHDLVLGVAFHYDYFIRPVSVNVFRKLYHNNLTISLNFIGSQHPDKERQREVKETSPKTVSSINTENNM